MFNIVVDRKTTEDSLSSRPNDLFALIVGGDKTISQAFDGNVSKSFPSEYFNQSPEPTSMVTVHMSSAPVGVPEPMYDSSKREGAPLILTCEDLEHKMLSECGEKKSNLQPTSRVCGTNRLNTEEKLVNVDSNASQHLLSLLQKGPDFTNMTGKGSTGTEAQDGHDEFTVPDRSKEEDTRDSHSLGKAVTLETLFGSAFMKELQSEQAPVSIRKNSVGSGLIDDSEAHKSSLSGFDDDSEGLPLPCVSYDQSEMSVHHHLAQPSSLQSHSLQMSQGRPLFHPMDSGPAHLNPQILDRREGMALHEAPSRQFSGNMNRPPFHYPNGGLTGFDLPAHHPMLQQMHMAGNNHPHLLHDHLRGQQVPSHLSNQAANIMQEVNRIQGLTYVPHQVNISGRTVQMPGKNLSVLSWQLCVLIF